tara:strand:- start:525 stop:1583 length:1059 start_codon:yes stop_codon:yes gene_type:complete
MPASKYKKRKSEKSKSSRRKAKPLQKQKQKQQQTVNIYLAKTARKTARKTSNKGRGSGPQPFYGLLNLTPPLNPSADLGNVVDSLVSRLSAIAVEKPISRAEKFRTGQRPEVPASVPVPPPVMATERVAPAVAFQTRHATSAQDIRRSPAMMAQLRERLASSGRGLTPTAQPADKFAFDVNYRRGETSPSARTLGAPFGAVDSSSVSDATVALEGHLTRPLPRQTSPLLEGRVSGGGIADDVGLLASASEGEEVSEMEDDPTAVPGGRRPRIAVEYPDSTVDLTGATRAKNLFAQHVEKKLPSDFKAEKGKGPALRYESIIPDQYVGLLNRTGIDIREALISGVEKRLAEGV